MFINGINVVLYIVILEVIVKSVDVYHRKSMIGKDCYEDGVIVPSNSLLYI